MGNVVKRMKIKIIMKEKTNKKKRFIGGEKIGKKN